MRIVGGRLKGRPLAGPRSNEVRPTSDRMRESLFNILGHKFDLPGNETRVLDLFAGTGALGLESLSRGAAFALFVEIGPEARGLIRANVDYLGLAGNMRLFRRDATKLGKPGNMPPFDLVFCDPPYGKGLGEKALMSAKENGWLAPGALCILEEASDALINLPADLEMLDQRTSGKTQMIMSQFDPAQTSIS